MIQLPRVFLNSLLAVLFLLLYGCLQVPAPAAMDTPAPTATATIPPLTLSGPETTPNSPRPYPATLTLETAQQGIRAVVDAPSTITSLADVQLIIAKHTQLARDAGLSFDHMAVKYVAADQRWFLVPVESGGMIAGWLEIADPTSQSGWRFGEQPTWDSQYHPSTDTYQYGLPALHDPGNHFEIGFRNGFPVLIEVTPSDTPQYWNNIAQKTTMLVEGAVLPTEIPIPEGLTTVPDGYSAVRNPDGSWGYGAGTEAIVSIPNLTVDGAGAHFSLEGRTIDIPAGEIQERIQVGQEGALQIYDYDMYGFYGIEFAWHIGQNVWIRAADIRQSHRECIPNYITVQTREQLAALFDLEKLVMSPFPADTYFPPLDKRDPDYMSQRGKNMDETADFNFFNPFGKVTDMAQSPFRFVNFILLTKGEGRKSDTWILTEQVYNPADGTFSLLHFGFDKFDEKPGFLDRGLSTLFWSMDPPHIVLPDYAIFSGMVFPGYESCDGVYCNQLDFFIKNNYWDAETGLLPEIQRLVEVWLTTGKVPDELERLVNIYWIAYIMTKTGP
jgi:hypothetical protein